MAELRVWAPRARRSVEVDTGGVSKRIPMEREARGWYRALVPRLTAGGDYGFVVDGNGPFPDPRSAYQPHGVHGLSRLVDHSAFEWTDHDWKGADPRDGVIYELHVGTFSDEGTFDGVIDRLDHLVDLGITAVELMPVAEFPGTRNWGYDGVNLFAPHHAYGGPDALKRLVDSCHQRGLAVILDVVYNHVGPEGNYLGVYGPYFTDFYSTPWGEAVNYDRAESDEVRRFVIDNACSWLRDYHCDGLRLDAVQEIIDTSATHLLEELSASVDALADELGRPLTLIAESNQNDPRLCRPRSEHGLGIHAQWSDDFHHALHVTLTGEIDGYYVDFAGDPPGGPERKSVGGGIEVLARTIERGWFQQGEYSAYRRRRHGRAPQGLHGRNLLGYAQNHDQIGNRAVGDRLSATLNPGRLRIAAALVLTSPFVPMLFQGEEWASSGPFQYFTDHEDRELGRAVAQGRRAEFAAFGWDPESVPDPQNPGTFERSRLDWTELGQTDHAALLDWHRRLIALRRSHPELGVGALDCQVEVAPDRSWLRVDRDGFSIVVNLGAEQAVPCPNGSVVLASNEDEEGSVVERSILLTSDAVAVVQHA